MSLVKKISRKKAEELMAKFSKRVCFGNPPWIGCDSCPYLEECKKERIGRAKRDKERKEREDQFANIF